MRYQFVCEGCLAAPAGTLGCVHEIEMPMSKAPAIGAKRKCVVKECSRQMIRIISTGVQGVVKGSATYNWKPGESMRMKLLDGREGCFQFVDHPHTDPQYQRNLAELAGRQGITGTATGLRNARWDEKHGRMVVDVASTIRDPLGEIERSKKQGEYQRETFKVNTPVKRRKKK